MPIAARNTPNLGKPQGPPMNPLGGAWNHVERWRLIPCPAWTVATFTNFLNRIYR